MSRKKTKKREAPEPVRDLAHDWADNLIFAGVLLVLFMRPFLSGRTYPHYNHFFHLGVGALALLWVAKRWRKGTLEIHNRLVTCFLLAFLVVCSLTFFTTVDKGLTLRYIYELLSYTLLFLVIANNFRESSSVKIAVATILSSALLVNAYGLYQHYKTLEMTRQFVEEALRSRDSQLLMGIPVGTGILHRLESKRVFSTFLYPNAYALFLGIVGGLTIGWVWSMHGSMRRFARASIDHLSSCARSGNPDTRKAKALAIHLSKGIGGVVLLALFLASCVLIPWDLWMTYSRGGLATAALIALVIAVVMLWARGAPSRHAVTGVLVAVVLASLLAPVEAVPVDKVQVRDVSFLARLKDSMTAMQRITYWEASLDMIRENPWLGVGWGAFEEAYPRYMVLGGYPVKLAHNNYLQVWAETGILGLNAFVGLWLVSVYTFWQKVRPGAATELRGIACGLGAGIIGFLANSLFDFALYSPTLAYIVFGTLGLLVAVPSDRDDKFIIKLPAPAVAFLVALIIAQLWLISRSYTGMALFVQAEKLRNSAFPTRFESSRGFKDDPVLQRRALEEGIRLLEASVRHFPLDSDAHRMLGECYFRLAKLERESSYLDKAVEEFKRAAELGPLSPYSFQALAAAYWAVGNATGRVEMFHKALEAEQRASQNFPVNPQYHRQLARIYDSLGFEEQAKQETALAEELQKHYKEY